MKAMNQYTAVIQAGGKGTRLKALTGDRIPKPMISLNGKPMIQWQMENIRRYGIEEFVFITGHLGEKIKEYFGDGSEFAVQIRYIEERESLGSAGSLYDLSGMLSTEAFLLVFGDVMFDIDLNRMLAFHEEKKATATLLMHPNSHPYDSDLLILEENGLVTGIDRKGNERNYWYENCVNAGIFVLSKDVLTRVQKLKKQDLEHDILEPLMEKACVYGYSTPEYVKDAGTPDRFREVSEAQRNGVLREKSLENKQKSIFLDRDGTLNVFRGLIADESLLELERGAAEAVKRINEMGYLAIVITNQPVVARGMCSVDDVNRIHRKLQVLLGERGAYLDEICFCPHHPDKGYPEENPEYKIPCSCRKPATGMIDKMIEKYNIDRSRSYMIGDSTLDIMTGVNAGLKTVLLSTGQAGQDGRYDVEPDLKANSLCEALDKIDKLY